MTITLEGVGKRFHRQWVLRDLSLALESPQHIGISGPNGSGKTTLLRVISGQLAPSEGTVKYMLDSRPVLVEHFYKYLSWAAPYLELVEEFSLAEMVRFHSRVKRLVAPNAELIESVGLKDHVAKRVIDFSSGMKQRLKLALALYSDTPVLLLDEPTSNLDQEGSDWFHNALRSLAGERLVVTASNERDDLASCDRVIELSAAAHT